MVEKNKIISNVFGIFPTPIYMSKLDRTLTPLELKFVNKQKKNTFKNEGNIASNNHYILNEKPFANIKKEIDKRVQDYFYKVLSTTDAITPYITQSWLNYTETNQYHHKHSHPNSLVSGVFYINCHEKLDKIKFFKDGYQTIKPEIKDWHLWNSETWSFTVKTGDIIMFPSSLTHMVENKEGTNTRISLAFNVFIKGNLGNKQSSNELIFL
jgi:uncharacterized protein (TIGR02466 family)